MLYNDKKFIGRIIRNKRKIAGLTQSELSEKLGMTEKNLGNIENGKQFPQVDNFLNIIKTLDISIEEFGINQNIQFDKTKNKLIKMILESTPEESEKFLKVLEFITEL